MRTITKGLYEDLFNLLTRSIDDYDYEMSRGLDDMACGRSDPDGDLFKAGAEVATRNYIEKRRLKGILEQFESEVEKPC